MTLDELNSKFVYKPDYKQYGRVEYWTVMKEDEDGKMYGDCEDYALTAQAMIDEYGDWDLYYVELKDGAGHCVLYKDGYVLDNILRVPTIKGAYRNIVGYNTFRKFWAIEIFALKLLGKFYKVISK